MKNNNAFTLIELLIVMAIVAILASIAYPSYQSYLIKMRRSDAQGELLKAQLQQSSLHILQPSYSFDKTALGLLDNQYYAFTVVSASNTTYLMKASAIVGASQINDVLACRSLYIDQNNTHTSNGTTSNDQCWLK